MILALQRLMLVAGLLLCAAPVQRIQVKQALLRSRPTAFAPNVGRLYFNTPVRVVRRSGSFSLVVHGRKRGYVFTSALIPTKRFNKQYTELHRSRDVSPNAATVAAKGIRDSEQRYARLTGGLQWHRVRRITRRRFPGDTAAWRAFRARGGIGEFSRTRSNPDYRRER